MDLVSDQIHIPLGCNYSITYQLASYGLRTRAYPFDWVRISLNQLIQVLSNGFDGYSDLLLKFYSQDQSSLLLTNKYGVHLAHEILDRDQIPRLESSIKSRIYRFKSLGLNTNPIRYYRIELASIGSGPEYIKKINQLCELLEQTTSNSNFVLILLIQQDYLVLITTNQSTLDPRVQPNPFELFDSDWRMNQIDWAKIFGIGYEEDVGGARGGVDGGR